MRALLLILAGSLLVSCADTPPGSAPRPFMKPAECLHCGQTATKTGMCEAPYLMCSGSCAGGGDPHTTALCDGRCFAERSDCIARAAIDDCPAYCK